MTRACTSSQPRVSTSHFMRARSLLSRLPWLLNTRSTASMVGMRSSLAVKSSSASAGCGLAPRPPATNTRNPASTVPSSSVRVTATTPTSLNIAWPQSVEQPEKLILNLRGRRWPSGLRTKWRYVASAHGVMSSFSWGQAPAKWQPMTLRTVSPQASRLVMPARPRLAHDLGDLLELDEVELHVLPGRDVPPAPRVGVGEVGHHLELVGQHAAPRDLHPHHLVVPTLALAVDAVVQAEDAECVLFDLAGQVLGEDLLELVGVGELCGIDLALTHGCSDLGGGNPDES